MGLSHCLAKVKVWVFPSWCLGFILWAPCVYVLKNTKNNFPSIISPIWTTLVFTLSHNYYQLLAYSATEDRWLNEQTLNSSSHGLSLNPKQWPYLGFSLSSGFLQHRNYTTSHSPCILIMLVWVIRKGCVLTIEKTYYICIYILIIQKTLYVWVYLTSH